jgi:hypothetical protein
MLDLVVQGHETLSSYLCSHLPPCISSRSTLRPVRWSFGCAMEPIDITSSSSSRSTVTSCTSSFTLSWQCRVQSGDSCIPQNQIVSGSRATLYLPHRLLNARSLKTPLQVSFILTVPSVYTMSCKTHFNYNLL